MIAERTLLHDKYPNLRRLGIGLGWDPQPDLSKINDLDISAFLLNAEGHMPTPNHIIFYHNKKSVDESVFHLGDNRSGEGKRDDEIILVNLLDVEEEIQRIAIVVTIYSENPEQRIISFDPIKQAFIRLFDYQNNDEIVRLEINERFSTFNSLLFGYLNRSPQGWTFEMNGVGSNQGLEGFIDQYA